MNFHDIEMLYINIYLAFALINTFTVFNGFYKYDTQLYNMLCFASNNIRNCLFFNNTYNDAASPCSISINIEPAKPDVIPYEQRYLDKVRSIPNIYVFTSDETQLMYNKLIELNIEQQELQNKLNHLQIDHLENSYESLQEEITDLQQQQLSSHDVAEKGEAYVINMRLNTLVNNIIMENTPLGNVIMMYDNKRETFNFYSDNIIPYRFLETVARKYVITYNCRPLYIDMEEELKIYEAKMIEHELNEKRNNENMNAVQLNESKKNVFAKLKSYNTEGKSGHVSKVPGPQNSVHNKDMGDKNKNRKIILKDNANRYSYQGKINNFSIIKRPDKKLLSKKLAMSFATFKQQTLLSSI